jgi:dolichol kinase
MSLREEARRTYDPNAIGLIGLFAAGTLVAVASGRYGLAVFFGVGVSWILWRLRQSELRWRDRGGE